MNNEDQYQQQSNELDRMLQSGDAFRFIGGFEKSKAFEETASGETKKFIEFVGSSDQEDLVGDVMSLAALKEMVESAPGTIMLRDHDRSTDKVFGWITEAKLVKEGGQNVIVFKAEVDEEDRANLRIWNSISKGKKLGASVTCIILSKDKNPNRKNGLIIESVKLLEISIVTIPCNQQSWTLAATASKALALAESKNLPSDDSGNSEPAPVLLKTKTIEENMSDKNTEIVPAPASADEQIIENVETAPAEAGAPAEAVTEESAAVEAKSPFSLMKAAIAEIEQARAAGSRLPDIAVKGMFNDILSEEPTFWDLTDILGCIKWRLYYQKQNLEAAGGTDFQAIIDAWDEAVAEFVVALKKSFLYWGKFDQTEAVSDTVVSNALDIQKSFTVFAELFTKSPEENRPTLEAIGKELIELASKAGIPIGRETGVPEAAEEEMIRKSQIFLDADTRAKQAESRVGELEQELEVAKAGLETATEALEYVNRQPLHIGQR